MASRENQGYVIGIIALAVIAVLLLVTTVFSTMKVYEYSDKAVAAQEDAAAQTAVAKAFESKSNMLAACLGLEGTAPSEIIVNRDLITAAKRNAGDSANEIQQIADSAQQIYAIYEKDMAFNTAITDAGEGGNTDADMTYRGTVDKMASALRSQTENAFDKAKEAKRIFEESEQKIANKDNLLAERNRTIADLETNLDEEKGRNQRSEAALQDQAKSLQEAMDDLKDEFADEKDSLEEELAKAINDKKYVVKQYDAVKAKLDDYEREVFDLPDGEIIQVAESSGSVFIDMGRLDGIRANLTFAVYDRTATDFEKDRHKAMIEVVEVLDEHLAKARVTDEDPLNPILTKDKILSATFDRGDAVTIALGGFFDLDGDGLSDLEKLKRMIVRNGGRVVASHDEDGNITGEIDSTTRFFVLGPSPRTGARSVIRAMNAMKEQAEGNSVDTIDLRKLLNWMGQHGRARVERMDSLIGQGAGGFQTRQPGN